MTQNIVTKTALIVALAALALPGAAHAEDQPIDVSVSLTGATEYVWRGVSQSDQDPAVFAAVNVSAGGFYAGAGTENVDFLGIEQEYDLWAGYAFDLGGGTKLDLGVVRYGYVDSPLDIDTTEIKAGVSGSVGKAGLGLTAYHTRDYFGSSEHATYVEASASYPLTDKLTASAVFGHQQIDNFPDYNNWNVGLSYAVLKGASVAVRYHDTDGGLGPMGDARVVGSFSVTF